MNELDAIREHLRRQVGATIDSNLELARVPLAALAGVTLTQYPDDIGMFVSMIDQIPAGDSDVLEGIFSTLLRF